MNAQSVAARVHQSVREPATELRYEGLVTRGIAFAIDAAIIDLIAVLVAGAVALVLSVLSVSKDSVDTLLVAAGGEQLAGPQDEQGGGDVAELKGRHPDHQPTEASGQHRPDA